MTFPIFSPAFFSFKKKLLAFLRFLFNRLAQITSYLLDIDMTLCSLFLLQQINFNESWNTFVAIKIHSTHTANFYTGNFQKKIICKIQFASLFLLFLHIIPQKKDCRRQVLDLGILFYKNDILKAQFLVIYISTKNI